jgi:hypothetical protein
LHDAIIGERLGLPSVAVLTSAFVSAGDLMARVLGAENYRFTVTPHPISSATDSKLGEHAHRAVQNSVGILLDA